MGLMAWALLAYFTWLDRSGGDRQLGLAVGIAAFVVYLVEIGYVMYLRSYATPLAPNEPPREQRFSPMLTWMATIVVLGIFGLTVGFCFPAIFQSFAGQLLVQSVTYAGVAAGLIFTMTGLPPWRRRAQMPAAPTLLSTRTAETPPPFWRVALGVIVWQLAVVVVAFVTFGPVLWLQGLFDRWIDIPACHRVCEAHGLTFQSFASGKNFYACTCIGSEGTRVFHDHAYVTGGHSFGACVVDWMFRAGTSMAVGVGWPIALVAFGTLVWARRKGRKQA